MQGIYTYIPETNSVPMEYTVAAILLLLFMVLISLVSEIIIIIIIITLKTSEVVHICTMQAFMWGTRGGGRDLYTRWK
jgi:hypothetical protein